eukprot:COSAG02_NODE_56624_length_284_cov_1.389189_1_plen_34_part_10
MLDGSGEHKTAGTRKLEEMCARKTMANGYENNRC